MIYVTLFVIFLLIIRREQKAFGAMLIAKTKMLSQQPQIGQRVPELGNPIIREIIVRSYRIVYRFNRANKRVEVIRFWHAARGTPQI